MGESYDLRSPGASRIVSELAMTRSANLNPMERKGPGNSVSPKIDFSVMSDAEGRVMPRWLPSWMTGAT
jgi:hypothetical protein